MSGLAVRAGRRLGETVGGKYKLHEILGAGGMSTVYAATHRNGHAVAIKVLHDELAKDSATRRWFLREAYLANQVNHRGAVRVFDDGVAEDGALFLIIERLYGDTLRAIWERVGRKLSPRDVSVVAYELLDVLAAAHARRIVHRDIKPENIFITDEGDVKVLDFGIAHPLPVIGEAASTTTFRFVGTPAFMAPEQARGADVRPETDIWAAGSTMFALITGEYVHASAPPPDLLSWVANRPARLISEVAHDLPKPLAVLIERALAFEPDQRFATAVAMRTALGEAFEECFGESIIDARTLVLAQLRGREPIATSGVRSDVHSIATKPPPPWAPTPPPPHMPTEGRVAVTRTATQRLPAENAERPARHFPLRLLTGLALVAATGLIARSVKTNAPTTTPQSQADHIFESAVLAWQDAAIDIAFDKLGEALAIDPNYADAHLLHVVLTMWNDSESRDHFRRAFEGRARLSPAHRALLEAMAPAMEEEFRIESAVDQLSRAVANFPDDALIRFAYLRHLFKLGAPDRILTELGKVPLPMSSMNAFVMMRGHAFALADDVESARRAYDQCVRGAINPTSCLRGLADLEAYEGNCKRSETLARRFVATNPESADALFYLARALHGVGADATTVRKVFEQRWSHLPKASAESHAERTKLDVLEGRFDEANADLDAWQRGTAGVDETSQAEPVELKALLALERGHQDEAIAIVERFQRDRASMIGGAFFDYGYLPLRIESLAGRLTTDDLAQRRTLWLEQDKTRGPRAAADAIRWIRAYIEPVNSSLDAKQAIDALPRFGALVPRAYRPSDQDYGIGRAYRLTGDLPNALAHLTRATSSCSAVEWPLEQTWAYAELGRAFEAMQRPNDACSAYAVVVSRWGTNSDSRTAREARDRMQRISCTQTTSEKQTTQ